MVCLFKVLLFNMNEIIQNNNLLTTLGTIISTIIAYVVGKNFFIPQLVRLWKWLKKEKEESEDRQISLSDEITKLKINDVERYEKTFNTLLNQISDLEEELKKYSKELQELRNTILKLNSKLYEKALIISDLQRYTCKKAKECELREICEINHIEKLIEDEE